MYPKPKIEAVSKTYASATLESAAELNVPDNSHKEPVDTTGLIKPKKEDALDECHKVCDEDNGEPSRTTSTDSNPEALLCPELAASNGNCASDINEDDDCDDDDNDKDDSDNEHRQPHQFPKVPHGQAPLPETVEPLATVIPAQCAELKQPLCGRHEQNVHPESKTAAASKEGMPTAAETAGEFGMPDDSDRRTAGEFDSAEIINSKKDDSRDGCHAACDQGNAAPSRTALTDSSPEALRCPNLAKPDAANGTCASGANKDNDVPSCLQDAKTGASAVGDASPVARRPLPPPPAGPAPLPPESPRQSFQEDPRTEVGLLDDIQEVFFSTSSAGPAPLPPESPKQCHQDDSRTAVGTVSDLQKEDLSGIDALVAGWRSDLGWNLGASSCPMETTMDESSAHGAHKMLFQRSVGPVTKALRGDPTRAGSFEAPLFDDIDDYNKFGAMVDELVDRSEEKSDLRDTAPIFVPGQEEWSGCQMSGFLD